MRRAVTQMTREERTAELREMHARLHEHERATWNEWRAHGDKPTRTEWFHLDDATTSLEQALAPRAGDAVTT